MERTITYKITDSGQNIRIDSFLRKHGYSMQNLTLLKKMPESILKNGEWSYMQTTLQAGDILTVRIQEETSSPNIPAVNLPIDIVYEDEDIIVINKAAGMPIHPSLNNYRNSLANALMWYYEQQNKPFIFRCTNRLDRDTSGLIIAAKNDMAHLSLSEQLQDHSLARTYEAIVVGSFRAETGTVDAPIARHRTDRKRMAVAADGRRAVTHWKVLERYSGYTHIQCNLETGRTHQIRVHMAYIGHPVLGDPVYGGKRKETFGLTGQCLHARKLAFQHPRTGERMEVECPLPDYFQEVLRKLSMRK